MGNVLFRRFRPSQIVHSNRKEDSKLHIGRKSNYVGIVEIVAVSEMYSYKMFDSSEHDIPDWNAL
jgi:hypothetical protein